MLFDFAVERKIAVTRIAEKRVPDASEMRADLVHAAGLELDFHEIVAFVMLLDAVMRDGLLCVFVILADEHLAALGAVCAQERFVDGAAVFLEVAFDERKVELVYDMFANHAGEVAERVAVEGCDDEAGCFLVKAVGDGRLEIETFATSPFPEVFHEAFAWACAASRLACESRRLVHNDVIFSLHDEVELVSTPVRLLFGTCEVAAPSGLVALFASGRCGVSPLEGVAGAASAAEARGRLSPFLSSSLTDLKFS